MIPLIPAVASTMLSDLQSLAADTNTPATNSATAAPATGATSFTATLKKALNEVNGQIIAANSDAMSYAAGDHSMPLSSVMVALEKANLAFQTAVTVRDRVTEAYSSVMNMQV
ncbi:MAG: flagellar hook-basal body complex protein FliE [Stellaceae bacterium]